MNQRDKDLYKALKDQCFSMWQAFCAGPEYHERLERLQNGLWDLLKKVDKELYLEILKNPGLTKD